jgi:CRISPR system Cascade subunit CasB
MTETSQDYGKQLASTIGTVARLMETKMSTGDLAELRRVDPAQPVTPALWKLLMEDSVIPERWRPSRSNEDDRDTSEQRWACLFMGMAHCQGLHDLEVPFGAALADAGWSEVRFSRLLRARGKRLFKEVRSVANYLSSKEQTADWCGVHGLLFSQDDEEWAERHRRNVARDYYRIKHAQGSE